MNTSREKESHKIKGFGSRLVSKWGAFWLLVDRKGLKATIRRIPKA